MKPAASILFFLALTSCELVTQVDIPEPPRVAVVNCIFPSDTTWFVNVQSSIHILSEFSLPVADLQVSLTDENGQQISLTPYDPYADPNPGFMGPPPRGSLFRGNTRPQPGITYRIEVSGSNVPTAHAVARAPVLVDIVDLKIDSSNAIISPSNNYSAIPIEFTFDDPVGLADYYYPRMFAYYEGYNVINGDTTKFTVPSYVGLVKELPNDNAEFGGGGMEVDAISDESFDGKRHTVRLYIIDYSYNFEGPFGQDPVAVRFYLNHANEEYFKYTRSLRLHENARDNPFAEPVQVFTNVEEGLGIFAGYTSAVREIK